MKYHDARKRIQSGDLLAWSHERSWLASWYDFQIQMVRAFTRSEYCHVGVAWTIAGRVFVLEAVGTGVRIFPLSRLLPFYWVPMKVRWEDEVEAWALAQVGLPYSKIQAILAGLGKLRAGEDSMWQCAEYTLEVLKRAGVDLKVDATPTAVVRAAQLLPQAATHLVTETM